MTPDEHHVSTTKQFRKDLDVILQHLKSASGQTSQIPASTKFRGSRERSIVIAKLQEAIMWLGMDLKVMNEEGVPGTDNPYPQSYNPDSQEIAPTADGLKL